VDDLPVVIQWLSQMRIERLIDEQLPLPHGNRQGLSYGQLAILLLSYIITQADHRLCAVARFTNRFVIPKFMPLLVVLLLNVLSVVSGKPRSL
jgi:hypothetical protein